MLTLKSPMGLSYVKSDLKRRVFETRKSRSDAQFVSFLFHCYYNSLLCNYLILSSKKSLEVIVNFWRFFLTIFIIKVKLTLQLFYRVVGLHRNQFFSYSFLQEIAWGHCQLERNPCSVFVGHLDDTWRILIEFGDFLVKTSGPIIFEHLCIRY